MGRSQPAILAVFGRAIDPDERQTHYGIKASFNGTSVLRWIWPRGPVLGDYEGIYTDDTLIQEGAILAAQFSNMGQHYEAYRYTDPSGKVGYFDADGISLRKAFIRDPVHFSCEFPIQSQSNASYS